MKPIPPEKLDELVNLYEGYEYAENPRDPGAKSLKVKFDSECQRLYQEEPLSIQKKMSLEVYQATIVIPDLLNHMQGGSKRR